MNVNLKIKCINYFVNNEKFGCYCDNRDWIKIFEYSECNLIFWSCITFYPFYNDNYHHLNVLYLKKVIFKISISKVFFLIYKN